MVPDRRGVLGVGGRASRHVLHRGPDLGRDLDPAVRLRRAARREDPGALHRLQHDPPGRRPVPLDGAGGLPRLHRAQPGPRHPPPPEPRVRYGHLLPAALGRRGAKTQEHCTVYNMIRLADVLFRRTGQVAYLDYIERNLVNGILAQQNPVSGMVTYFLPLEGGARKVWGSPTEDFWCCHGTLVQAHTRHSSLVFYADDDGSLTIAQHIAAQAHVPTPAGE